MYMQGQWRAACVWWWWGAGGRWVWYCLLPVNEGNHTPMFRYLMHCNSGESSKGIN